MQSTASMQAFGARGMLMLMCPIVQNASSDSEHVWFILGRPYFYVFFFFLKEEAHSILDGKITVDTRDEIEVFLLFISN